MALKDVWTQRKQVGLLILWTANYADTTYDASAFDIPCLLLSVDRRRQAHPWWWRWSLQNWGQEQAGMWQRNRRATGPLSIPPYYHMDSEDSRGFPRVERTRSELKLTSSPLRLQRLFSVDSRKLDLVTEYEFEAGADAPMSMAYSENVRVSIHWPWVPYPYKLLLFHAFCGITLPLSVLLYRLWCKRGSREDREGYQWPL